jgi:DNA-directed RNA polymerase specialized sigma24 family protein
VSATDPHQVSHRTIEAVWRIESAHVIAGLTPDLDLAENLAQEALVAALEQWPQSGVLDNPAARLTATAKRRAIDLFRRNAVAERKHEELARELEALEQTSPDLDSTLDNTISDDLLRLVFIACHPILPSESRATLTLGLLGGLTTDEIARAFSAPNAPSPTSTSPSRSPAAPSSPPASPQSSKSSTSSSTRATPPPSATTSACLKFANALSPDRRDDLVSRLDHVRTISHDFGYGVGDDLDFLLSKYTRS